MTFKAPVEDQDVEMLWERGYFWGFWKVKIFVKGTFDAVQRVLGELRKGKV